MTSDNCEDLAKMQVSQPNNVKIYNLSAGKSLPEVSTKDYRHMSFLFSKRIGSGLSSKRHNTCVYVAMHGQNN